MRTRPPPLVPLATGRIPAGPGRVRSRTNAPGRPASRWEAGRDGGEGVVRSAGLRAAVWARGLRSRAGRLSPRRPRTCLPVTQPRVGNVVRRRRQRQRRLCARPSSRGRGSPPRRSLARSAGHGRPLGCGRLGAWRGRGGPEAAGVAARDAPALALAGAGAAARRGSMLGSAARPR